MDLPERIRDFVGGSSIPITIAYAGESDLPLRLVNDAFCNLTGYRREDILGRNCRFLQGDLPQEDARAEIRQAIRTGADCQVLFDNFRADGSRFKNLLFMYPVIENGRALLYIGSQFELKGADLVERSVQRSDHLFEEINQAIQNLASLRMARRRNSAEAVAQAVRGWMRLR